MRAWRANPRLAVARTLHQLGGTGFIDIDAVTAALPSSVDLLGRLASLGLVTLEGRDARMTRSGRFWAGNVSRIFALAARDQVVACHPGSIRMV
jgi:hypothetical protein